jgi:hypothetical protein
VRALLVRVTRPDGTPAWHAGECSYEAGGAVWRSRRAPSAFGCKARRRRSMRPASRHGSVVGTTAKAGPRTAVDWEPVPQGLGRRPTIKRAREAAKEDESPLPPISLEGLTCSPRKTPLTQRERAALAQLAEAHRELEAARRAEWSRHHHTPYREVPYPAYSAPAVRSLPIAPRSDAARHPVTPRRAAMRLVHAVASTLISR